MCAPVEVLVANAGIVVKSSVVIVVLVASGRRTGALGECFVNQR